MLVQTIQTGSTIVSSAVPDRSTYRNPYAYTGLFQNRKKRIEVPVKCFYVEVTSAAKKKLRYGKLLKGINVQSISFADDASAPFSKSCDIYKDGSVIAYFTPTHSAGSVVYKVSENGKYALIVGDNGYKDDSWNKGLLPGPIYNKANTAACLEWIRTCSEDADCLGIFCAHNPVTRRLS